MLKVEEQNKIIWVYSVNKDGGRMVTNHLPGSDVSKESKEIQDLANEIWTEEVKIAYLESIKTDREIEEFE